MRKNSFNDQVLFWASFLTLIAAGMGFSIRGDILSDWGRQFGFTQTDLGEITGMGLVGFGVTIIFFSFFADTWGYGKLMVIAFLFHTVAVAATLAAPYAFQQSGKSGAYWCLYLGALAFSLGNGTCEAVINPLTATLFPHNKTHWLNILHAGWPGGLVLGALVGLALNQFGITDWRIRWGIVFAPMLLYGLMMLGRLFPTSETKEHGVGILQMMREVGMLGAAVVVALLGLWLAKDLVPSLLTTVGMPAVFGWWAGWGVAALLWVTYGIATGFGIGHWMLAFLFILHGLIGYVELGTDSWIVNITDTVLGSKDKALMAFIWTNILMFTLRFFAGPIVHMISPLGLLFVSAVLGTAGLYMLGMPAANTTWLWVGAVTVYGIGKTFYWPTMLGVVSERFPKGGAIALGFSGGVGMLAAGILGGPGIGYKQDYAATTELKQVAPETYERYKSDEPKALMPFLPKIAGLDNAKVGVLNDDAKQLNTDLELLRKSGGTDDKNLEKLERLATWWDTVAKEHREVDKPAVQAATVHGGKTALTWTAAVPAAMAVGYLLLILYFQAVGGYKAEVLAGHATAET